MSDRLEQLLASVEGASRVLILPHNDPDPDSMASCVALCRILRLRAQLPCLIAYKGVIGRAENRELVQYLGHPLKRLKPEMLLDNPSIALVDTQPGAGNNALPPGHRLAIVLDHHSLRPETAFALFSDVRLGYGSTATILLEYLDAAGVELDGQLATALFYGVKTDTMALSRGASDADIAAYFRLQQLIDVEALVSIERAQVPQEYFRSVVRALQTTQVHDSLAFSYLGHMAYPDLAAEMTDLLLRMEGIRWVLCAGEHRGELMVAVRTRSRRQSARAMVLDVVGGKGSAGGHGSMAGGQIPLSSINPAELAQWLLRRALLWLKLDPDEPGKPLI